MNFVNYPTKDFAFIPLEDFAPMKNEIFFSSMLKNRGNALKHTAIALAIGLIALTVFTIYTYILHLRKNRQDDGVVLRELLNARPQTEERVNQRLEKIFLETNENTISNILRDPTRIDLAKNSLKLEAIGCLEVLHSAGQDLVSIFECTRISRTQDTLVDPVGQWFKDELNDPVFKGQIIDWLKLKFPERDILLSYKNKTTTEINREVELLRAALDSSLDRLFILWFAKNHLVNVEIQDLLSKEIRPALSQNIKEKLSSIRHEDLLSSVQNAEESYRSSKDGAEINYSDLFPSPTTLLERFRRSFPSPD